MLAKLFLSFVCLVVGGVTVTAAERPSYYHYGLTVQLMCEGKRDVDRNACHAYISAIADVLATGPIVAVAREESRSIRACVPASAKFEMLSSIVVAWIERNMQFATVRGAWVVAAALEEKFPCR